MPIAPINIAPPEFLQRLDSIEPGVWGTPCAAVLRDGSATPCALAWVNPRYSDAGSWTNPQDVLFIDQSPSRMPAKFAHRIHDAGESGMGYHVYVVHFADGSNFVHFAWNQKIDLVSLPEGYTTRDIVRVDPNCSGERAEAEGYREVTDLLSIQYARPGSMHSGDA